MHSTNTSGRSNSLCLQDSFEFQDKDSLNLASCFEPVDDSPTLLKVGQQCEVFKPAHGVDWWPGRILTVKPADSDANATYTVEFLSGYYLGDVDTDVPRNNIDASRPFRNWMGAWRGEVGKYLFGLGVGGATQNGPDDWTSKWEQEVGKHLFAGKGVTHTEGQDLNTGAGWKSKWRQEIGQFLFAR